MPSNLLQILAKISPYRGLAAGPEGWLTYVVTELKLAEKTLRFCDNLHRCSVKISAAPF